MIQMNLHEAAQIVSGELITTDANVAEFSGVTIDSRKLLRGQLFAAFSGFNVDGHRFVDDAFKQGAAAVLVSRPLDHSGAQILVEDVQLALGKLATSWLTKLRSENNLTVIAVTGSNGKTTVKEMLGSVLTQQYQVLMTRGNLNNELGLPLTLMELDPADEFAVLELGASHPGDIAYLCGICLPDIALLNNVGPAHLQGFGDLQGVAKAKGEIYAGLQRAGTAIVNADEPWLSVWQEQLGKAKRLTFGSRAGSDVSASLTTKSFDLQTPAGLISNCQIPLPGQHNRMNALAAVAVLQVLEIPLDVIKQGLEKVPSVAGRLNTQFSDGGWKVIDDSYNANPASLYAGISVMTEDLKEGEVAWLVLGDMAELGNNSSKLHKEMGAAAAALGVQRLFAVGEQSQYSVEGFGQNACHYLNKTELLAEILERIHPGVICLVKGSRSMGMEDVVSALLKHKPACNEPNLHKEAI